jgi:hypothetical protein
LAGQLFGYIIHSCFLYVSNVFRTLLSETLSNCHWSLGRFKLRQRRSEVQKCILNYFLFLFTEFGLRVVERIVQIELFLSHCNIIITFHFPTATKESPSFPLPQIPRTLPSSTSPSYPTQAAQPPPHHQSDPSIL